MITGHEWHGEEVQQRLDVAMDQILHASAYLVENEAKRLLSVAGTAPKSNGKGRIYGANRSKPGEAPRKQRGVLRASVGHVIENKTAKVGTGKKYGLFLQMGTRKMAARPWLDVALLRASAKIVSLIRRFRIQ